MGAKEGQGVTGKTICPQTPRQRDMGQIHVAGDADTRKKDQPPPPAGYSAVAFADGHAVFKMAGVIAGNEESGCSVSPTAPAHQRG